MTEGYSLADISAATGGNRNGMFGGDGSWWIIVLFLFAFCGWGGQGIGTGRSGGGLMSAYATQEDISRGFDTKTTFNKLNGLENGLCDGFYAMNTSLLNGFNGVNQAITNCCCDNREAIAGVNYNLATQSCATNTNIANSSRDIIDSQKDGTRAILERLTTMEMNAKDERIAALTAENQALNLAASQTAQNQYLVSELAPKAPIPAFSVPNPYAPYYTGCNC